MKTQLRWIRRLPVNLQFEQDPDNRSVRHGRGLSMNLGLAWGAAQSGVQPLWSRQVFQRAGVLEAGPTGVPAGVE